MTIVNNINCTTKTMINNEKIFLTLIYININHINHIVLSKKYICKISAYGNDNYINFKELFN